MPVAKSSGSCLLQLSNSWLVAGKKCTHFGLYYKHPCTYIRIIANPAWEYVYGIFKPHFFPGLRNSGKTAVAQHLRMTCSSSELPAESERIKFIVPIYKNVIIAAKRLIKGMQEQEIPFESVLPDRTVETITALDPEGVTEITPMLMWMMGTLWRDNGVQTCFKRLGELGLGDSTK